jgi:hypothetical protein
MAQTLGDACYVIDIIDECIREFDQGEPKIGPFSNPNEKDDELNETEPHTNECLALTPNLSPNFQKPTQELKELPKNLRYEFLDKEMNRPVIFSSTLNQDETNQLLNVLQGYPSALGYNISDLKGIIPSVCMHRISL